MRHGETPLVSEEWRHGRAATHDLPAARPPGHPYKLFGRLSRFETRHDDTHHSVRRRRYGSPLARAPRTVDGRHARAGLLARGSVAGARLPTLIGAVARGRRLAADSCGGSRRFGARPHCVPFYIPAEVVSGEPSRDRFWRSDGPRCQSCRRAIGPRVCLASHVPKDTGPVKELGSAGRIAVSRRDNRPALRYMPAR